MPEKKTSLPSSSSCPAPGGDNTHREQDNVEESSSSSPSSLSSTFESDNKIDGRNPSKQWFMGFQWSENFVRLWTRLEILEKWRELAIRPCSEKDCHPDDIDMFHNEVDDYQELVKRCIQIRQIMNHNLPLHELTILNDDLIAKPSAIPGAGLGLFYEPTTTPSSSSLSSYHEDEDDDDNDKSAPVSSSSSSSIILSKGTVLCYYTGHIHNFHSARTIQDRSYLMLVQGDILVDPGPCSCRHIKARYINDPLNESLVNCKFVPDKDKNIPRSSVVAMKSIKPGDELFVSYGDAYWSQHETIGQRLEYVAGKK